MLQHVAVGLQRRRGVVDQLKGGRAGDIAPLQQERQDEARGGGAYCRGEQVFRDAQQMNVGFHAGIVIFASTDKKRLEGLAGARRAEITGDRRLDVRCRHARTP